MPGLIFVIPVFNDWRSFHRLIETIDQALEKCAFTGRIVAINDGSFDEGGTQSWQVGSLRRIADIEVIDLVCNMGHQRAIAIGLATIAERDAQAVVVMDADGEDDPADLPKLLEAFAQGGAPIVLAQRIKRSEKLLFRAFYVLYKLAFRWLTGFALSFGNYCVLSMPAVQRLVYMPNLWNSLPATCLRSRLPTRLVPTNRGIRYDGISTMSFVNLVLHGLQAITVFSDAVLVRLTLGLSVSAVVASLLVVLVRFLTNWVPLGWASTMLGFIWMSVLMATFGLVSTSLLALQDRSTVPLLPKLHGATYVRGTRKLYG